jgi:hypothetical protein
MLANLHSGTAGQSRLAAKYQFDWLSKGQRNFVSTDIVMFTRCIFENDVDIKCN